MYTILHTGIYEQVVNQWIASRAQELRGKRYAVHTGTIDDAESSGILARYIADILQTELLSINGHDEAALSRRIELCNRLIAHLAQDMHDEGILQQQIHPNAQLLLSLLDPQAADLAATTRLDATLSSRPATSLAHSSLFTGGPREPSLVSELKKEILTSDRIDLLVSFIKWSGLRLLMNELQVFTARGQLRVVTTPYMGATDIKAIDELRRLPHTDIRVSYDTEGTRLHAKAYVFYRNTGFSTAYIGSSNLSGAALSTGLEWNVKVTRQDLPETFAKIQGTFDAYWHDYAFADYKEEQRPQLVKALQAERYQGQNSGHFLFDIAPYPFQAEILDLLQAQRELHGRFRNLVVAATGTGKTVISAFDYKRFCRDRAKTAQRLLFVAHREEILTQSLACFRAVLRDANFGDLYVGTHTPDGLDHLFVSIQMINARNLCSSTPRDYYDFIVVDEFHHASAESYQALLAHFEPAILLGLTATPERLDGEDVTAYFDYRIAAEIRLPEAIERGLLTPFQYFGVSDSVDLRTVTWRRGGYDHAELSRIYTGDRQRADLIVRSLHRYVTDMDKVIGLGFCVSIAHADFMAAWLNQHGIAAKSLHAKSPAQDRLEARRQLTAGELHFLLLVDLYNEGIDIPEINTVMFLRPTESLTIFLQQLGRGLRRYQDKVCLTVLDFIGQSHRRYRFEEKFQALLTRTTGRSLETEIREGFQHVPRGSYIQLEKQAQAYVLDGIREATGRRRRLITRLQAFAMEYGHTPTLSEFAESCHITMRELYQSSPIRTYAQLCADAGLEHLSPTVHLPTAHETQITRSLPRIASINARHLIACIRRHIEGDATHRDLSERERQMLLMMHYTVWQKPLSGSPFVSLEESMAALREHPRLCKEISEVLRFNQEHLAFVDEQVDVGFDCALDLHCDYSRDQALCALGYYTEERMPAMREGVKHLADKGLDVLFITLNKSARDYSPTTMYQDYAISDALFHWQSQSTTSAESPTGQRYIHHKQHGDRIVLFVREQKEDGADALPYTYLGTASYVQHTGSRPMNITWRLHRPLPAHLLRKANQLVVM